MTNCWVLIKMTIENELSWLQSFAWIWLIYSLRSFIRRYQAIFRTADLLNMISKSNSASLLSSLLTELTMNWFTLGSLSYLIEIQGQKSEIHAIIVFYSLTSMTVISTWSFLTDVSRTRCSWLYILLILRIVFNLWILAYSILWSITTRKIWTTESLKVKNFLEYQKETSLIYFNLHIKLLSHLSTSKVNEKRQNCCLSIHHRS